MSTQAGAIITDNTLNSIFDNTSGPESSTGRTEFRAIFIHNNHNGGSGGLTYVNARVYLVPTPTDSTPSGDDTIEIGLEPGNPVGAGIVIQSIGSETAAPSSVTFSKPLAPDQAIPMGDIPSGSQRPLWVKRTVSPGAQQYADNYFDLEVLGETL